MLPCKNPDKDIVVNFILFQERYDITQGSILLPIHWSQPANFQEDQQAL